MGDLSKNFSRWEFECRGCCGLDDVKQRLIDSLQRFRDIVQSKVVVRSGRRCFRHNMYVGGRYTSQHLYGTAADLETVKGMTPEEMARIAVTIPEFRMGGIGVYDWGIHVDVRTDGPARWGKKWRVKK